MSKYDLKIYFAGSIRGGRDDDGIYIKLIQALLKHGEVLTEHVGDESLTDLGESQLSDPQIYIRDMNWLVDSDVMIAEVTVPSLGVGYEISKAESNGKPVLCLYREQDGKRLSAMIRGNHNHLITKAYYHEVQEAIDMANDFIIKIKAERLS